MLELLAMTIARLESIIQQQAQQIAELQKRLAEAEKQDKSENLKDSE